MWDRQLLIDVETKSLLEYLARNLPERTNSVSERLREVKRWVTAADRRRLLARWSMRDFAVKFGSLLEEKVGMACKELIPIADFAAFPKVSNIEEVDTKQEHAKSKNALRLAGSPS